MCLYEIEYLSELKFLPTFCITKQDQVYVSQKKVISPLLLPMSLIINWHTGIKWWDRDMDEYSHVTKYIIVC